MHEERLCFLLDQNVPGAVATWLRQEHSGWIVNHVNELGFQGRTDEFLYKWAQDNDAIVISFDEDFADSRSNNKTFEAGSTKGSAK
ncbi:MAG: DUF5615 family PIN-like protein [Desulfovermiculus sp.]|nr:DUF5615 family PIN-like protein [Desulfovermiculus sp.]